MLQFKRDGKIVESGVLLAPDFVCVAVKEYRGTVSLLGNSVVWQGTGVGALGDVETWEISTVEAPQ